MAGQSILTESEEESDSNTSKCIEHDAARHEEDIKGGKTTIACTVIHPSTPPVGSQLIEQKWNSRKGPMDVPRQGAISRVSCQQAEGVCERESLITHSQIFDDHHTGRTDSCFFDISGS